LVQEIMRSFGSVEATRDRGNLRPLLVALLYLIGVAFCFVPTVWVLRWYGFAVPVVVAWCALAAFVVHRSRKRAVLGVTLAILGGLLIVLLVGAVEWVPRQMVP